MSDETDKEQREAEKKAGKEITKAKKAVKTAKVDAKGSKTDENETRKFKRKARKLLNRVKGLLAKRDYEGADNTIDELRDLIEKLGKSLSKIDGLTDALDKLEQIKDEELWISPTVAVETAVFDDANDFIVDADLPEEKEKPDVAALAMSIALENSLDSKFEGTLLGELRNLPLVAIEGLSPQKAEQIQGVFKEESIAGLVNNKLIRKAIFLSKVC